jgi:hypothetical protein
MGVIRRGRGGPLVVVYAMVWCMMVGGPGIQSGLIIVTEDEWKFMTDDGWT